MDRTRVGIIDGSVTAAKQSVAARVVKPVVCSSHSIPMYASGTWAAEVGSYTNLATGYRFPLAFAANDLQLLYTNWYNVAGTCTKGLSPITIKASISYTPDGGSEARYNVTFGGQLTYVLQPGTSIVSDPVPISVLATDAVVAYTWISDATDTGWVAAPYRDQAMITGHTGTILEGGTGSGNSFTYDKISDANSDVTATGTPSASTRTMNAFIPVGLIGIPSDGLPKPTIGIWGDSIAALYPYPHLDTVANAMSPWGLPSNGILCQGYGSASLAIDTANAVTNGWYRYGLSKYITHAIVQIGTNDITGASVATVEAGLTAYWKQSTDKGIKVWACTLPPARTTSTDAFATVANQTVVNGTVSANIDTVNTWIKAQVATGLISGVIDVNAAVADATVGTKWKAGGFTWDGIHPSDVGLTAIMAVMAPVVNAMTAE